MKPMINMVYVHADHGHEEPMWQRIIDFMRAQVMNEGFVVAARDAPSIDRVIRIGTPLETGWIPLDGSLTGNGDAASLQACGQAISHDLSTAVLVTQLVEDDSLELWLYVRGTLADHYASDPIGVRSLLPRQRGNDMNGKVAAWADILVPHGDPTTLKTLFRARLVRPDEAYATIATQIGLNPRHANGLHETDVALRLCFQGTYPVVHAKTPIHDEPCLRLGSYEMHLTSMVGQPFELMWQVHSAGASSSGLVVRLYGTALEHDMLSLSSLTAHIGQSDTALRQTFEQRIAVESIIGTEIHVVFPDIPIPSGHSDRIMIRETGNGQDSLQAHWRDVIILTLKGTICASGEGQLSIETYPQAGSSKTGTAVGIPCHLHPLPPLSPHIQALVAQTHTDALTTYLFDLTTPRILQAHIVLPPTPAAQTIFLEAFEQWHSLLSPLYANGYYALISAATPAPSLHQTRLRTQTIPDGKRWMQLRQTLRGASMIMIQRETQRSTQHAHWSDTFIRQCAVGGTLEQDSVFFLDRDDSMTAQMSLWVDLHTIPPDTHPWLLKHLIAIVDTLFATHHGIQAYLARWKSTPDQLDCTPYELIHGVNGHVTLSQAWCTQFLRGVTDHLWLGSALLARIDHAETLSEHGVVHRVSDGIRINTTSIAQLHALETILTPVIPTVDDWMQADDA